MMKRVLLLLLTTLSFYTSFAQNVRLDSERWITKSLGHLYFSDKKVYYNFVGFAGIKDHYTIVDDTLIMTDIYHSSADNFKKERRDNFKFLIRHIDQNRAYIKAIETNAIKLAGNSTYEFFNFKNSYDKNIKFAKVYFLSSTCFGDCPQLAIEIWPNGDYHLKAGEHAEPYKGDYTGKLSQGQLDTLNYWLKHSELKKMINWEQGNQVTDAPNYYFAIDFVNNKKKLSITTNEPPLNIIDLINFMLSSYKKINLVPVAQ
ncbi:DUF6438 domain-containing protein [Mucilaginibacter sabulilitoris]|uniref:DUF6438 domain-containing protein n=1 Tax=Mucilaginibacter sabulilitoris TaxID=1173583 RepID=A0ABZ0TD76_9SPHI|nr:DUF6438 domain-containing protein [Mucilaginibacter sabulilitoris]WPU91166.1 DUF6438 domain-containing protein [Mucilaginibacter sabulilitoris]